jgi:cell division protein FtsB
MNNKFLRYFLLFVFASAFATPAWSLTAAKRIAALEKAVIALKTADTELTAQVNTLKTANAQLTAQVNTLTTNYNNLITSLNNNTVLKLHGKLGLNAQGDTAVFQGLNVQIVNGLGGTNAVNGKGNLIIGYNEIDPAARPVCSDGSYANENDCIAANKTWANNQHTGSHYLVTGWSHSYTQYGGVVMGYRNAAIAPFATVNGGQDNIASGGYSSISGGSLNTASGNWSSVSGGSSNTAAIADNNWAAGSLFQNF